MHSRDEGGDRQRRRHERRGSPSTLLLVRHGESAANVDNTLYQKVSDHAIRLSERGEKQAAEAGTAIARFYCDREGLPEGSPAPPTHSCRAWVSPYSRARQTADILAENSNGWITDLRESILLVEQQFGLFEGRDWNDPALRENFEQELDYYYKAARFGGRFWAKVPLGESRFDVAMRIHQCFGSIHRDISMSGCKHHVVVSHGLSLRAFVMMWNNKPPEWLDQEPNFGNCAIRFIDGEVPNGDRGYIHGGPVEARPPPSTWF
jgi:2,3-bisphosphoglycerate-dependent phosphoglycerate mutase